LCDLFASLIDKIQNGRPDDQEAAVLVPGLEARVIWSLMVMCRSADSVSDDSNGVGANTDAHASPDGGLAETVKRLQVLESLLTGHNLASNPLVPEDTVNGTAPFDPTRVQEREFWQLMGRFLTLHDDEASSAKEIDDTLSACRNLLQELENRDVIYSIAIASHLGSRVSEFPHNVRPVGNDEQDAKNKLYVAKKFIEDEAMGKGTTQVIQRICGMAVRSWTAGR